jgi:hypothetical protein
MPLTIAALLGLSAALIVLYPLLGLRGQTDDVADGAVADVAERERAAKGALREVEFDHRLGNLENDDYVALRDRYESQALAALRSRYGRERELDALIDRQLEALLVADAQGPGRSGVDGGQSNGHGAGSVPQRAQGVTPKRAAARRRRGGARG